MTRLQKQRPRALGEPELQEVASEAPVLVTLVERDPGLAAGKTGQ